MSADTDLLDAHKERIEDFAERLVRPYLDRVATASPNQQKEFNDPIWGTLYLKPEELTVLDSPLIQRLRRIKQLGVVHYVYPAATHTRLEHSLGVVHQVQRMIASINERGLTGSEGASVEGSVIGLDLESTLRLAALCHDVGHGFMSHVSEFALERLRPCEDLQLTFQRVYERPELPQLSELAAYYMVGSPAFAELLDLAFTKHRKVAPEALAQHLQDLIVGKPISESLILIHELISGPFDADKLDYYARDAFMCGIPNVTDIPRLIQKLRAAPVARESLPASLKKGLPNRQQGYVVTGIATSGGRTLDELALARTLLYDKVYRHQKVRAIESMVSCLISWLVKLSPTDPTFVMYALSDDELLDLDERALREFAGRDLEDADAEAVGIVSDLSSRLRDRRLFSRGFAFASVMTNDDYRHDPHQTKGLQKFLSVCVSKPEDFMTEIRRRIVEIASLTETELPCPPEWLSSYVLLSPPKTSSGQQKNDIGNAQLIDNSGRVTAVLIGCCRNYAVGKCVHSYSRPRSRVLSARDCAYRVRRNRVSAARAVQRSRPCSHA